mgnify:CR=1 FL=1
MAMSEEISTARNPYQRSTLRELGRLRDLTAGSSAGNMDVGMAGTNPDGSMG